MLLEKRVGVKVISPAKQTCCGQSMANSGYEQLTGACNQLFVDDFAAFDYIVYPSGSCVLHVKDQLQRNSLGKPSFANGVWLRFSELESEK